jgi:hypothetical protein
MDPSHDKFLVSIPKKNNMWKTRSVLIRCSYNLQKGYSRTLAKVEYAVCISSIGDCAEALEAVLSAFRV